MVAPLLPLLLILFFISGTCALIYQVLWMRLLALVFGVTVYAASTVLASFMAGLALGSAAAGRVGDRARNPLLWFGATEALVGISALATPVALRQIQHVYAGLYPSLASTPALLTIARFVLSFAVLIVPTMLMGATLPLIIKSSLTRIDGLGARVGLLYGTNTLGAILGTVLTGFYLIPELGISLAFKIAAAGNLTVGLVAVMASLALKPRRYGVELAPVSIIASDLPNGAPTIDVADSVRKLVLIVFALSGFTALALEVVWFRVLVLFLRPTTYAFTVMLAMVLAGIALGSYIISPVMRRRRSAGAHDAAASGVSWLSLLAAIELAIAIVVLVAFTGLTQTYALLEWLGPIARGPKLDQVAPLLVASALAILPATIPMGMAFPLGLSIWAAGGHEQSDQTARRVGVFYSLNVCGAILGSIAGGFLLLPYLGSQLSIVLLAVITLCSGFVLLAATRRRQTGQVAGAAAVIAFVIAAWNVPNPFVVLLENRYKGEKPLWREEGVQTTVSVHERMMREPRPNRILYLEGLHQSNDSQGTVYTHRRIGLMPTILHPDPANALVIGLGGGATAGAVSQDPNLQVDVVELSQSVVHGAQQWFKHINFDLFQRPNVHLRVDDGRNFLALARKRYDVVTADIILPIHAGAGHLYSAEYFRLVHNALSKDGVVLQWIEPGRQTEYKLIMRTFLSVFPNTTLWADGSLMVATLGPLRLSRSSYERKLQEPRLGDFMRDMGFGSFERLMSIYVAGPEELRQLVGPGPILTDDRPTTEYFLSLPLDEPDIDLRGLHGNGQEHVVP